MKNRKLLPVLAVILPIVAALLSALPNAVRMDWFGGFTTYCSAYSLIPVGYAIWGPMAAAVGSIVLIILGLLQIFRPGMKLKKWMIVISAGAVALNVLAAFLVSMTLIEVLITCLLGAEIILLLQKE